MRAEKIQMVVSEGQIPGPERLEAARQVLRLIAARQRTRAPEIARRIFAELTARVPEYAAITDERLAEDVRSVSAGGVLAWLDLVLTGKMPGPEQFEPMREGARRRARQGFDHYALLRAWRLAIRVMWSELIQDPEAQDPSVRQVLPELAEEAMNYSDQVSLVVTDGYLEESTRAAREQARRRSALLELILSHPEEADRSAQPSELAGHHVVLVAETGNLPLEGLDRVGLELERHAHAVFWTVRHEAVVAVVPVPPGGDRDGVVARLRRDFATFGGVERLGVGGDASGVDETRQSYLEAVEALTHGPRLDADAGPVFDFVDVGSYALLASDAERAKRFVQRTLAPLQAIRAPWLEPTLEAYLSRQGRLKEAALKLHVHPNTVKYRLGEVRDALGPVLGDPDRAAQLLTALRLRRLLDDRAEAQPAR
jgi:hypothetical protein